MGEGGAHAKHGRVRGTALRAEVWGFRPPTPALSRKGRGRYRRMLYANIVVQGLLTGAVYALMALGLSVIFGVIRIVNFAHGEMMVVGMFAAYLIFQATGIDPLFAMPAVAALLFAFGYVLQRGLINRFVGRPDYMQFLLLLGIAIMLTSANLMA